MLGVSIGYNQIAIARNKQNFPPPGELIDVNGHAMHINCLGEGSPTVILEAGASSWSVVWSLVQKDIAKETRVCSYDRAGLGWSEPGPQPRTAEQLVSELHALLTNAGIDGPYVMVGHSFGGPLVRVFTGKYPDDVIGLVLVDAAHPDQISRFPIEVTESNETQIKQFALLGKLARLGFLRFGVKQNVPTWTLPEDVLPAYFAIMSRPEFYETTVAEMEMFDVSMEQTREAGNLGDRPLIVLAAGQNDEEIATIPGVDGDAYKATRMMLQEDLATLSTNSQLIVAEKSGHAIQLYQPDSVIGAVLKVVEMCRPEQ
jgi:pimeloyl-ACP methyl ester carboxylesterase